MISVCIATYNGSLYIKEQLTSILHQIDKKDEIIISDNNSTDNTVQIIESIGDERLKIFINPVKDGFTYNFANALVKAKGDYIFFSDQDDVWIDGKVKEILPYLKANTLILHDAYFTDSELKPTGVLLSEWRKYRKGYFRNLYKRVYTGCTMAFTKEMKDYFLPIPKGIIGHDAWIGLLSELKYEVKFIDKPLIYYRRHNSTVSFSGTTSQNSFLFMVKYRLRFLYHTLKRYLA